MRRRGEDLKQSNTQAAASKSNSNRRKLRGKKSKLFSIEFAQWDKSWANLLPSDDRALAQGAGEKRGRAKKAKTKPMKKKGRQKKTKLLSLLFISQAAISEPREQKMCSNEMTIGAYCRPACLTKRTLNTEGKLWRTGNKVDGNRHKSSYTAAIPMAAAMAAISIGPKLSSSIRMLEAINRLCGGGGRASVRERSKNK